MTSHIASSNHSPPVSGTQYTPSRIPKSPMTVKVCPPPPTTSLPLARLAAYRM